MAELVKIERDKYRIIGLLNENDINKINSFKNRTIFILDNTAGLSSDLISKIKSNRVVFSIIGGLDYEKKEKYKEKKYVDRTFVSSSGLKKIIEYFEYNESLIDSNWNEFEKAMFLYNALVVDMEYAENYENIQSSGTTERSLNGILYGKLVCAGFAQVYKEMLDRIEIKNYYQNQKDVHAFNIIEIDGKKYGVDVTWDNNTKNKTNGKCGFGRFGHDPDYYTRHGHQLYEEKLEWSMPNYNIKLEGGIAWAEEQPDWDFDEEVITTRVYDKDEEIYDLSLLTMDQLNEYYDHISTSINNRKPFRFNLQDQPLEIKNKYLPVDIVEVKLKQEAEEEYPILIILDFLKKRNALQISPQLIRAFSNRYGYLLDIGNMDGKYNYGVDLSLIGIDNYNIDRDGTIIYEKGYERRHSAIRGILANSSNMPQEELNKMYDTLNQYLNQYFNQYISDIISSLDTLLTNYEYEPNEWDSNRAIESGNIETKLAIIIKSRDYLIQLGMNEQEVDSIIEKITSKYNEIHEPYKDNITQKDMDIDFLYTIFSDDLTMIRETMEYDLGKQLTDDEFISLYKNVDYMIQLFEKYVIIGQNSKFKMSDYSVSKEDIQQILNETIQNIQLNQMIQNDNTSIIQEDVILK